MSRTSASAVSATLRKGGLAIVARRVRGPVPGPPGTGSEVRSMSEQYEALVREYRRRAVERAARRAREAAEAEAARVEVAA